MAKKKAEAKQDAPKQVKEIRASSSAAIAAALSKHWPTESAKIVQVMADAAKASKSWMRKLARLNKALAKLQKGEQS